MLDVLFWKGDRFSSSSLLDVRLFTKPSSIWKPLSPESMHAVFVHRHWPIAQCTRIQKRFSCKNAGERAVEAFKTQLFETCGVCVSSRAKTSRLSDPISWLVLPFTFAVCKSGVNSSVRSVWVPPALHDVCSKVRISWSLGNKRLMHLLRPSRCTGKEG